MQETGDPTPAAAGAPARGEAADGRRSQARGVATRGRVLAAARHLFIQRGYDGTSVVQIAERAEVGVGTLYHHFADKRAVLLKLVQDWSTSLEQDWGDAARQRAEQAIDEMGVRTVLEGWIRSRLDRISKEPTLWGVVVDVAGRDSEVREHLTRVQRSGALWLRTLFERLHERGAIRSDVDATAAAWLVRDALDRVARQYVIDGVTDPSRDRMIDQLLQMICRYLLPESDS